MTNIHSKIEKHIQNGEIMELVGLIFHNNNKFHGLAALKALAKIKNEQAFYIIIDALRTNNSAMIRWNAAEILGEIGDERAIDPLIRALNERGSYFISSNTGERLDDSKVIRYNAIRALEKIGHPISVEPLMIMLNDPYDMVRNAAKKALKTLKSSQRYKSYKLQQANKLESAVRYEDAAKIYEDLEMYNEAGRVRKIKQESQKNSSKQFIAEHMHVGDQTTIKDSVLYRSSVGKKKSFSICPYCGEDLNLSKTPNFCPYCKEKLS